MKVKSCSALDRELSVLRETVKSIFHNSSQEKKSVMAIGDGGDYGGVWRHRLVMISVFG